MQTSKPIGKRVSSFRVLLLVLLGSTLSVGFTAPGKWAAGEVIQSLDPGPQKLVPQYLSRAWGEDSRDTETRRAVGDLGLNDANPTPGSHPVPSPKLVSERLAGIDGWTTAVLFDIVAEPGELLAAGMPAWTSVLLAGESVRPRSTGDHDWFHWGPIRTWKLALFDDQGRCVGLASVSALRPGFVLSELRGELVYVESPGAPGDGDLPAVSMFHRTEAGAVVIG